MSAPATASAPRVRPGAEEEAPGCGFSGTRVFSRIEEVSESEWDSLLASDDLQRRHAFVRACQDAGVADAVYRHVLVYREGTLVGTASIFRMDVRLELLCPGFLRTLIEAVRRWRPAFLRPTLLLCGLPVSAARSCIAFRSRPDAPFVLAEVARCLEQTGEELGARLLCLKEFGPDEADLLEQLREHGYFRAHSLPAYRLPLPWHTFEAYVAAMRAGYRRQVRGTLRAGRAAGFRFRSYPGVVFDWERFFPLYEQVLDRARYQLERLNLAFFQNLARYLPDATRVLAVEQGDDLLAAAVVLETPGLTTFFMTGLDYARNLPGQAYPNLVTEVVRAAIATGTGRLDLGQTSDALKCRLGGVPEPRWLWFRYRRRWAHLLFRALAPLLFPPTRADLRRVFRGGT